MTRDVIQKIRIGNLDFQDNFFDSLRADYGSLQFNQWLNKKSEQEAYVFFDDNHVLGGFLYLKDEEEEDLSIVPYFNLKRRLKIGTFKIDSHGTVLGQRFLAIILRQMINDNHDFVYVTLFSKQKGLISLFEKFGFQIWGYKNNGELIYYKDLSVSNNEYMDFPRVNLAKSNRKYLLAIFPKFHTKLFPDSKLCTERVHSVEDLSFTNTSEKIYLTAMNDVMEFQTGDLVVIYRTAEKGQSAEYSSVVTSICTVVEVKHIQGFDTFESFIAYCGKGTIFSFQELSYFWSSRKYPFIIKMLYNVPLEKRITRNKLIEEIGLNRDSYFGCMSLTDNQFREILGIGEINESFVID